ncbi:uncharacterized protein [Montipora capricornis]|uniref:uncharacterized protein n=1 Tax=Montipora capricornis TaxID=246305 RepID=UPI0035F1AA0F
MGTFTEQLSFEVIWKPFFLNPTLSKAVPLVQHLSNLYGADAAASIVKPTSRLSRDGAEVGIQFNPNRLIVNTLKSHCMLDYAKTEGKQNLLAEQLFHAFFEEATNIDSDDDLAKIAVEIGLNWDAAQRHMKEVRSRVQGEAMKAREDGIRGVPYITIYVKGGQNIYLSGAQPPEEFVKVFRRLLAQLKASA